MDLPRLIMLVGLPGSGKSTWLSQICPETHNRLFVVCPDLIRKTMFGSITDQTHNVEVWAEAKKRTSEYLLQGLSVIIDAVNVNTFYRRTFIQGLPPCKLQAILFKANPGQCWERVKKDIKLGRDRSNVPERAIYRMHGEFLYTEKVIESEGFELVTSYDPE